MVRDSHLPNSSNLLLQRTPNTHTHRHTDTQKNRVKTMNFNEPTRSRRPPRAMVRKTTAGNDFFGNGWICMDLHCFFCTYFRRNAKTTSASWRWRKPAGCCCAARTPSSPCVANTSTKCVVTEFYRVSLWSSMWLTFPRLGPRAQTGAIECYLVFVVDTATKYVSIGSLPSFTGFL